MIPYLLLPGLVKIGDPRNQQGTAIRHKRPTIINNPIGYGHIPNRTVRQGPAYRRIRREHPGNEFEHRRRLAIIAEWTISIQAHHLVNPGLHIPYGRITRIGQSTGYRGCVPFPCQIQGCLINGISLILHVIEYPEQRGPIGGTEWDILPGTGNGA